MQKLVLLVVGAVWLAVLVPPLLRSRGESRPNSSVDHFRRHLAILQKTTPSRLHSMQSMARPLAGGSPGTAGSYTRAAMRRSPSDPRLRRSNYGAAMSGHDTHATAQLQRRSQSHPRSHRALLRRRREQVVRVLVFLSTTSAILAFLAKSPMLIYACAFSTLSLIGYCAMLLRLRRDAELYAMDRWQRAA